LLFQETHFVDLSLIVFAPKQYFMLSSFPKSSIQLRVLSEFFLIGRGGSSEVDGGCQLISKGTKLCFWVISPGILFVLVQMELNLEQEELLRRTV